MMTLSSVYSPGSLSRLLESGLQSDSAAKPTKLQKLFSQPTENLLRTSKTDNQVRFAANVLSQKTKAKGIKSSVINQCHQDKANKGKTAELAAVYKREESLRNAEADISHRKQKKSRNLKTRENVLQHDSTFSESTVNPTVQKTAQEINAENASKRIARKSGIQSVNLSRRDTSKDDTTVFVGNVALSVSKKTILRLFKTCGKVLTVRLRSAPVAGLKLSKKANVIKQQFHPSRHTANYYVVFESLSDAQKALSLNGAELEGMHLRVDLAAAKKHDHQKSVFVGNVPFDAEEEDLRRHFSECGEINNVRIIRDKVTGVGKGFGYITFLDSSSVSLALSMNDRSFNGRPLRVQRSTQNQSDKRKSQSVKNSAFQRNGRKRAEQAENRTPKLKQRKRKLSESGDQSTASTETKRAKVFDAKAAADRRRNKEKRKKKIKRIAIERKKDSIGQLLTKKKTDLY